MSPAEREAVTPETHCPGCGEELVRTPGYCFTRRGLHPEGRWWHFDCLDRHAPLTATQREFLDRKFARWESP